MPPALTDMKPLVIERREFAAALDTVLGAVPASS